MIVSRERMDDACRDVLALVSAYLDDDHEGGMAVLAAQDDQCFALVTAAVGMLMAVATDAGHDLREWVAAARERVAP